MNSDVYWIWFNAIKCLTLKQKKNFLDALGSPRNIFEHSMYDDFTEQIDIKAWRKLHEEKDLEQAKRMDFKNKILGIKLIRISDVKGYLDEVSYKQWPLICYYRGILSHVPSVAIIGTRKVSYQGEKYTEILCDQYHDQGMRINTTLTEGVELKATKYCVDKKLSVNLFTSQSLETKYSSYKQDIVNQVLVEGAVITPFSVEDKQHKYAYVVRNRLMILWSEMIFLAEAHINSKVLSTIKLGSKYKKSIETILGPSDSVKCGLNNFLIENNIASGLSVSLDEAYRVLFEHPVSQMLRREPLTRDEIDFQLQSHKININELLLKLEMEHVISYKADGKWHYNGW